jgi:alkanesulfonate monooxygenase SsuD/methylene tetrahydromethanopterin reductase-like flavin-dependent oxidoreductase (luciferase family)
MRARRSTVFGITVSGVLAAGLLFAPIALAANYAPTLPPATVGAISSPTVATQIGATGSGVVLVSAAAADRVTPTAVDNPAATAARAPKVPVVVGRIIVAEVGSLQASTKMAVTTLVGGKKVNLGSARTDANGDLTLPGIRGAKPGTITVQITAPDGTKKFVKIVVRARR